MRSFLLVLAIAVASIPSTAAAQATSTASEFDWTRTKYQWAVIGEAIGKKCKNLTPFYAEAVTRARKFYKGKIAEAGYSDDIKAFSAQVNKGVTLTPCNKMRDDQRIATALDNLVFLGDEYLLAIHFAGVSECGVLTKARMEKLVKHLPGLLTAAQNRPDFGYLEPVAKARGAELKKTCSGILSETIILLQADEDGSMLIKAVEHFEGLAG